MEVATKKTVEQDFAEELAAAMVPLAQILQQSGISMQQLVDAYRYGLVQATRQSLRKELGTEPTKSRVAVATGMSRPVVAQYFEQSERPEAKTMPLATQIAYRWGTAKRWRNAAGKPLDLPFAGIRSFSELCESVSKKVRPRTFLDELEAAGVVESLDNGSIRLLKLTTVNYKKADRVIGTLRNMRHFMSTLLANLEHPNTFYEQLIGTSEIPPNRAASIQQEVRQKLRLFVKKEIIPLLAAAEVEGESFDYLAVGLFQAHEPSKGH